MSYDIIDDGDDAVLPESEDKDVYSDRLRVIDDYSDYIEEYEEDDISDERY